MNARMRGLGLLLSIATMVATAKGETPDDAAKAGRKSGYEWLTPQTRQLQDDEFANPGMLWVEAGEASWKQRAGAANKSCADCHGDAAKSMRGVSTRYPAYSPQAKRVIDLEQRVDLCRTQRQQAAAWVYESKEQLGLIAYVSAQSKGLPQNVAVDGKAAASFERGRDFFSRRRGQLNLSCANCHDQHVGAHLRGEPISQGQINGFPIYRQLWQAMGSTHRMFAWCNEAVRAEPYAPGSQEYVDLELYVRWRGRGLPVETPAVRR
jgi:L-cysteine S-thiosulfotransferase